MLKHKLDDTMPDWFDMSLLEIYQKKRDRSKIRKRDRVLTQFFTGFLSACPVRFHALIPTIIRGWILRR